ncbi:LysR family transcriptional regulator [Myxococcus sp. K15C18031901]|uniref:LysR family transcriptional regulator n=1 Tax=Myxococcus dinghuensis TaxID=2906761 RepID=UPI0020A80E4C|nr:LysR family transcriptional regulator [Myxococcus dinghuensis]MCP3100772.1 LysR family transcriptional regulator [Myxococcus dinghuensis]
MADIPLPPTSSLDVRDLRVVLALATAGTTAKAAARLHLTQPAVSRALLGAEEKLATRLFDRTPRGLVPTAAGRQLIEGASRLLVELGDLERGVRAPEPAPTRLRLVCGCYTAYHWLPSTLLSLRQSLPGLEVRLAVEHTRDPIPALEAGDIDMALVTTSTVPRERLETRTLFTDEIVFVLAAGHPLARKKTLTRADLQAHPLLTSPTPPREDVWFVSRVFGRERPTLRVERLPLTEAILDMARAGLGIGMLSEWIIGPHLRDGTLVTRRLGSGPLVRTWRLAYRRQVEAPALRLAAVLEGLAPKRIAGS